MTPRPKVSVVVPTYNYAHFLSDAVNSVLAQTFTDFELIVVDNCSTDNTSDVIKPFLADNRISFYQNEKNIGLANNWNKCLEYARGEYIKFLCADDKIHPQLLEKFVAVLDQNPGVSIVSSYLEEFGDYTLPKTHKHVGVVSGEFVRKDFIVKKRRNWLYAPSAVMFRRADIAKVGTFHSKLFHVTDKEYYLRLLTIGNGYVIPEILSYLRIHANTQSTRIKNRKFDLIFENYRYYKSIKKHSPPADPLQAQLQAEVRRCALECAKVVYRLLPKLHKKEARSKIKTAFEIGKAEGVLLLPLKYYLWQKHLQKPAKQKARMLK